jgi:hypothetical protein
VEGEAPEASRARDLVGLRELGAGGAMKSCGNINAGYTSQNGELSDAAASCRGEYLNCEGKRRGVPSQRAYVHPC